MWLGKRQLRPPLSVSPIYFLQYQQYIEDRDSSHGGLRLTVFSRLNPRSSWIRKKTPMFRHDGLFIRLSSIWSWIAPIDLLRFSKSLVFKPRSTNTCCLFGDLSEPMRARVGNPHSHRGDRGASQCLSVSQYYTSFRADMTVQTPVMLTSSGGPMHKATFGPDLDSSTFGRRAHRNHISLKHSLTVPWRCMVI